MIPMWGRSGPWWKSPRPSRAWGDWGSTAAQVGCLVVKQELSSTAAPFLTVKLEVVKMPSGMKHLRGTLQWKVIDFPGHQWGPYGIAGYNDNKYAGDTDWLLFSPSAFSNDRGNHQASRDTVTDP